MQSFQLKIGCFWRKKFNVFTQDLTVHLARYIFLQIGAALNTKSTFFFSKHGLVVSGQNKMYMSGGEYPDGSASQAFWRYDPVLDVWQEMAPMQSPRSELGNKSRNSYFYIYILGCFNFCETTCNFSGNFLQTIFYQKLNNHLLQSV